MATRFKLLNVRLAFAQGLFKRSKPPKADANAKEKYRVCLIIPKNHPQLAELKAAIQKEMQSEFGDKWQAVYKAAEMQQKLCLRDGDLKEDYAGFPGNFYLSCSSDIKPTVYGYSAAAGPISDPEEARSIAYSGAWVNASLDIKVFNNVSKGCSAYIRGVQRTLTPAGQSDEALGGGTAASDEDFDEIGVSAENDPLVA